jgi:hypothetical protein
MEFLVISGAIAFSIIFINHIMTKPQIEDVQWQTQQVNK